MESGGGGGRGTQHVSGQPTPSPTEVVLELQPFSLFAASRGLVLAGSRFPTRGHGRKARVIVTLAMFSQGLPYPPPRAQSLCEIV